MQGREHLRTSVLFIEGDKSEFSLFKEACRVFCEATPSDSTELWVKLSSNAWVCDENYLITFLSKLDFGGVDVFSSISRDQSGVETDVVLLKGFLGHGLVGELLKDTESLDIKSAITKALKENNFNLYLNPFRNLQRSEDHFICRKIGWTMNRDLNENLRNLQLFNERQSLRETYTENFLSFFRRGESDLVMKV